MSATESNVVIVNSADHADARWNRYADMRFASRSALAPLVASEVISAAVALPIGFVRQPAKHQPVAVLGLSPGENWYVRPDGRWSAGYTPAVFRSHPFCLVKAADEKSYLGVNTASDCFDSNGAERVFEADGTLSASVQAVQTFLQKVAEDQHVTDRAVAMLDKHALLSPWEIVRNRPEGPKRVDGLLKVDEQKLRSLGGGAMVELNTSGALILAYCQLLSMQHLKALQALGEAREASQEAIAEMLSSDVGDDIDLSYLH